MAITCRFICYLSFVICYLLIGGDEESRTPDPLLAKQVLSQLSYTPAFSIDNLQLIINNYCIAFAMNFNNP